jgi:protein TonB
MIRKIMLSLLVGTAAVAVAQQGSTPPAVTEPAPPDFRSCAKPAMDEKASTFVHLTVTAEGAPIDATVSQSSGDVCLDDKAVVAVQHYRFRPATRGGEAIATKINIRVDFERRSPHP